MTQSRKHFGISTFFLMLGQFLIGGKDSGITPIRPLNMGLNLSFHAHLQEGLGGVLAISFPSAGNFLQEALAHNYSVLMGGKNVP